MVNRTTDSVEALLIGSWWLDGVAARELGALSDEAAADRVTVRQLLSVGVARGVADVAVGRRNSVHRCMCQTAVTFIADDTESISRCSVDVTSPVHPAKTTRVPSWRVTVV